MSAWRRAAVIALLMAVPQPIAAQSLTVRTAGDVLHVRAAGLPFIEGRMLDRLQDGRSVRIDFEVAVFESAGGPVVATAQHAFNVSFDLWEERFAVSRIGMPARSISHLRARDAEAWCLDNVTLPVSALGRLGRDVPFWARVTYRVQDPDAPVAGEPLTLWTLIDVLSRRPEERQSGKSVAGGPFRLSK